MTARVEWVTASDCLRLTLDAPKGNVLDSATIAALCAEVEKAKSDPRMRAIVIDALGRDFCFGASVEEHLPNAAAAMLAGLHRLLLAMVEAPVPVLIAVQGRCLGGGLELALAGSRIFASPGAVFGQPEVKLGLFAPAASVLLPERVRGAAAEDLLLTGRTIDAAQALAIGLIDELSDARPLDAALAYVEKHLLTHSRSGMRFACRAARVQRSAQLRPQLEQLEALYLKELMPTADALEGLSAFLEKRPAKWAEIRQ